MKRRLSILLLLGCGAGFVFGLVRLFQLRLAAGDVYPEYSSLRADPLGTMAFCESLQELPQLTVSRDFSGENALPEGRDTTYLHLAARTPDWSALPAEVVQEIEGFLYRGGRLVVSFYPETGKPYRPFSLDDEGKKRTTESKDRNDKGPSQRRPGPRRKARAEPSREERPILLKERWGFELDFIGLEPAGESYAPAQVRRQIDLPLPEQLDWHSATIFKSLTEPWRKIYVRGPNPVVIERPIGAGTLVLASDSYFLSNEALLKDPHADLLAWLVGPSKAVVFDEAHFGMVEQKGVASLLRKYRLGWAVLSLLLLAGLFVWKNSSSFAQPYADTRAPTPVLGRDAYSGFVNLLRRHIAPRDLLKVCFDEWKKSPHPGGGRSPAEITGGGHDSDRTSAALAQAEALLAADLDPLGTYRALSRALHPPPGSRRPESVERQS